MENTIYLICKHEWITRFDCLRTNVLAFRSVDEATKFRDGMNEKEGNDGLINYEIQYINVI